MKLPGTMISPVRLTFLVAGILLIDFSIFSKAVRSQQPLNGRLIQDTANNDGDTPFSAPAPRFTRSRDFVLPFTLTEFEKLKVSEVQLHSRTPDGPWQRRDVAGPRQGKFQFKVVEDGEFWFAVVTQDEEGRTTPADLRNMPPALRVVVDSTPPTIQLALEESLAGLQVRVTIRDTNLVDTPPAIACLAGDMWHALLPVAGNPDLYALPIRQPGPFKVRVFARDLAGNQGVAESLLDPSKLIQLANARNHQKEPVKEQAKVSTKPLFVDPRTTVVPGKIFVNSTNATLEYAVDEVGPSGVGMVEIWISQGSPPSWKKLVEDTDLQSPAVCQLPGEGEYGVCFVIRNGAGGGGLPPSASDKPVSLIEVDITPPAAKLLYAQVLTTDTQEGPALFIRWDATDKNLDINPISFFIAPEPGMPFIRIGEAIPNSGEYRWFIPKNCPSRFYLRLEVRDAAGNCCILNHPTQLLMDPARPKGRVVAIRASQSSPEPTSNTALTKPATFKTQGTEYAGSDGPLANPTPASAPSSAQILPSISKK